MPHKATRESNNYAMEELQNTQLRQADIGNQFDEISLKYVKKVKSSLSSIDVAKLEWVESSRTEGTPCDKMCHGKKRIIVNYVCMRGQRRLNESMCPGGERLSIQYKEETCNNDCELKLAFTLCYF